MTHRRYINEWKSINHEVMQLSRYVSHIIWKDSFNGEIKLSDMVKKPYIEGCFEININNAFMGDHHFDIEKMNIRYIMYMLDSYDEVGETMRINKFNSLFDRDTSTMTIICYSIKGKIHPDFIGDIYHEIEHLFQYGMGMEKRSDLYDMAIEGTKDEKDEIRKVISFLIYFTFPHEQDAFANQFYGLLKSGKYKDNINGDELIMNETEYARYYSCLRMYKSFRNTYMDHIREVLNRFGLTLEQFNKRVHYGGQRLKNKLLKVYQRYEYEKMANSIREGRVMLSIIKEVKRDYNERYKGIEHNDEFKGFYKLND